MVARLAALIGVLAAVSACSVSPTGATPEYPEGTSVHSLDVSGLARSYRVYKPAGLPVSAPLVVMLHGGFGSAEQAERSYGWDQLADAAKFVVAYPDGVARAWNAGGGCCGRPAREGVDDVGFITAAVDDVAKKVGIDSARVYATGISNGGIMAYRLACNTAIFAAVGPDSATQLDACRSPHPTSVMHIHGTADTRIRYGGGEGDGVARINGPPVADVNAFWRNVDQCAAPAVNTSGALTTSSADCPDGRSVVLITVDGGGHQWPPFATQTFWQFFAAHSR
ncbi:alpha/beta hydrolase family esterase [Mycobacterium xenopi]|uniref:Polyhydroxybutyrate depolymerase n=1 Tax=Mycobacterium xenopi TaxID=1789 RepID=A0AAD1H3V4_MYCXE|nr:PHB depolymerase family esterase [Mycobacterium xenopi]MDA3640333.1 polyhydroxybutyrate depolymerase [Mycobacterium xenopi]MDA3658587.1 polyhydroxybutyrate depolymerase [Mycobacterium xenopi]MDA3664049.1 polyhydroxybutyrate depolymerase [Mycobacterium xenopi]ORX10428.1 polyhydroxybutyrate depolymerase [Mycobacterium xenopi]SPX90467.1 lipoprotein LpqP [Mycobacterium xenopi]